MTRAAAAESVDSHPRQVRASSSPGGSGLRRRLVVHFGGWLLGPRYACMPRFHVFMRYPDILAVGPFRSMLRVSH